MARYFLHLHECGDRCPDEEAFEAESADALRTYAFEAARDIMAAEVLEGRLCVSCHIEVEVSERQPVMTLSFSDAIAISGLSPQPTLSVLAAL